MLKRIVLYLILVFFTGTQAVYAKDSIGASETLVCAIEPSMQPEAVRASSDGRRVAYEAIKGGSRVLVLDGKEKVSFNYISGNFFVSNLVFSPDGRRAAYHGYADGKHFVFVDGEEPKQYEIRDYTFDVGIAFSSDGKHIAYRVGSPSAGQCMVMDGVSQGRCNAVTYPKFIPDSNNVYYIAREKGRLFGVVGGKDVKFDSDVVFANIGRDGNPAIFMLKKGDKYSLVADGQAGPQYDEIRDAIISPDGKRVAYAARLNDKWFVVVDGTKGRDYGDYWEGTLCFSPDSRRVAYIAAKTQSWKKKLLGETEMIVKTEGAASKKGPKWVAVVDGKELKPFDYGTPFVNNAGWEKPKGDGTLVFSPDGRRVAYIALASRIIKSKLRSGQQVMEIAGGLAMWYVAVDGKEGKQYDEIRPGSVVFSPDGRHVAYVVKTGEKWSVAVDGKTRKPYDAIVSYGGKVIFDPSGSFRYLAREESNIYLVQESLN